MSTYFKANGANRPAIVLALVVLAFAAVLGGVFYRIAMDSAVETARKRREAILSDLSRTEGPVVSE